MEILTLLYYVFLILLVQIPILYSISPTFKYYWRICWFNCCIVGAACFYLPIGPFIYMRDGGANAAFKIMTFLGSWAGIKVEVRGLEKLKNHVGPAVLLSNHQSSIDLMMLGHYMPDKCCIMSKKSLQYVPVFGIAGVFAHTIFIDRTDKTQALKSVEKSCDIINNSGFKLFMYPEGTRNHGHGLLPFKKGAFNIAVTGDIPIIPIVISDYANFYSKPNKYFHNDGKVICEVLDQIKTVGMGKEDVNALVEKTRNAMLECYERISKEVERPNQS